MAEKEERLATIKRFLVKYKNVILISWLVLSMILLISGAAIMNSTYTTISSTLFVIDYTGCKTFSIDVPEEECRNYLKKHKEQASCECHHAFNLNLKGSVTLYYQLPNFTQTSTDYSNSKDDNQLKGILTKTPSNNCSPYQYDNNSKPIAPCGAIADSMPFDYVRTFQMQIENASSALDVPLLRHGMLSADEKAGFKNPYNLTNALKDFAKPPHWPKYIYELDLNNEENNGFQNEFFISWMKTDRELKPIARVNHGNDASFKEGLPNGTYQIMIDYYRSPHGYDGPRHLVFGSRVVKDVSPPASGGVLLALGILMLAAVGLLYAYKLLPKMYSDWKNRDGNPKTTETVDDASPSDLLNSENAASAP